jgi:tryptophan synthase alpha chain
VPQELEEWVSLVRKAAAVPVCVGFGISTPEHVAQVVRLADGAVIGSALVDFLHKNGAGCQSDSEMRGLVTAWKDATRAGWRSAPEQA